MYDESSINKLSNKNTNELEYLEVLNKYDDTILKPAINLINHINSSQTMAEYKVFCKSICTKPSKLDFYGWLIDKSIHIKKTDKDILISNGFIDEDTLQPTDALCHLQDALMQLMGWDKWKYANLSKIREKVQLQQLHCNSGNEALSSSCIESCNATLCNSLNGGATLCNSLNGGATLCNSLNGGATLCNYNNNSDNKCNFTQLIHNDKFWLELGKTAYELQKTTPYKKNEIRKYIEQLKHLIEPLPKSEYIKRVMDEYNIGHSTVEQHIKILKHKNVEWVEEYKGDKDTPYLKLTCKFYDTINDMELQDAVIISENKILDNNKKIEKIKEFVEKYLDDDSFKIDITTIDDLEGKDRTNGAYFRSELLNNPGEVIKLIYKIHDKKTIKPDDAPATPIDIIIAGLECVRSRKIEKVDDWGRLKNKLCLFKGDIVGVLHHKVRRPLLVEYECNATKDGKLIGCNTTILRLIEPMENDKKSYIAKCPKCGLVMQSKKDAIGRKLERDITICLLQLQGTDELYKVYLPYTKNIYDLRAVDIVGVLKTNSLGEYYIEGISINPRQNNEFSYEGFREKIKEKGYNDALEYIKDIVFYEIKKITHKDNATIDNILTLEVLASSHICYEHNRDGNIKPETIDFMAVGGYGMGKSITINALAKLHNITENTIKINNANIENLIALQTDKQNIKFMKKGLIPLNHNRPVVFEEFMDWVRYIGDGVNQLKDGKTSGYWKRERGGDNIAYIGVSPWVCFGNIPNHDLMKLWELLFKDKSKFEKELINYMIKYKKMDDDKAKKEAKEITNYCQEYHYVIKEILDLTIWSLRGMVDRIPLIYLLKPYTDDELDEIDDYLWELEKQKNDIDFIKNKEIDIYECHLFIEHIKNKNIEFNYETFQAFKSIKRKLRKSIIDLGYIHYSDRLFKQIEHIAKAYAKLRFKDEVDIYDLDDAVKLWKKSALGVLLPYDVKKEINETIGAYKEIKEINKILKQHYEPIIIKLNDDYIARIGEYNIQWNLCNDEVNLTKSYVLDKPEEQIFNKIKKDLKDSSYNIMIDEDKTLKLIKMVKDAINKESKKEQQQNKDRERISTIINIIKENSKNKELVDYNTILEYAKERGLTEEQTEATINKLIQRGDIDEPRAGKYKII